MWFLSSQSLQHLDPLHSLDPRKILDSVGRPLPREWSCSNDFDDRSRDKEQGLLFVYLALDIPWIVVSSVLIIYMFLKEKEDTNHQQIESILHGLVIGMIVIAINSLMVVVTSNSLRSLVINCRGFDQTLSLSIAMSWSLRRSLRRSLRKSHLIMMNVNLNFLFCQTKLWHCLVLISCALLLIIPTNDIWYRIEG